MHGGVLYSHKKNNIMSLSRKQMELDIIILTEISYSERQI
jgi:hypothetical protein